MRARLVLVTMPWETCLSKADTKLEFTYDAGYESARFDPEEPRPSTRQKMIPQKLAGGLEHVTKKSCRDTLR
jgi:hypothetical protein